VGTQTTAWEIGKHFAGKTFVDALGYRQQEVVIDENGWQSFIAMPEVYLFGC